jgi:hypothetical protein
VVRSIIVGIFGVGLITGGIALFLGGRAKQSKSRLEKFKARKTAEAAGGSDQPSLAEALQGLADAVSKAQMSDLEKQVLFETWASEGLTELQSYADKLMERTVKR